MLTKLTFTRYGTVAQGIGDGCNLGIEPLLCLTLVNLSSIAVLYLTVVLIGDHALPWTSD
jgi:hypothetical protein